MEKRERYTGAIFGLAVGDALGTTIEFRPPGTFEPVTEMVGGGPFGLQPGQWTDDTSLALCLAESLVECKGFDAKDQMERYVRWYRHGHLSSTGSCFDIGGTTSYGIHMFEKTGNPFSGSTDKRAAGNGSLMRLAPVPDYWKLNPLVKEVDIIARGSFKSKEPPEIRGTGYVIEALEAALWAFHKANTFEEGVLLAVNLGDDADTTGAIYGQIAGAFYGIKAIPRRWLDILALKDTIEYLAEKLYQRASLG